ncbi:LOB domain-containing protein CRL1-like [Dioscorea cayenensis subsp. rotundata]|uniref:LOB domain-containing protein CRL1-like n=1 Tax=Dioscorea cayennensis subsp. rotundata TaxID=55577 RepID=A0AB40BMF4_DIOCR|nr:LOB domain-containing protein CRL1-like [Dioscorea cayenensis subsp. rotundata]
MAGFGSPCGACKFLRRKCVKGCVFAPYFCHDQGATHFAAIHKVFGASNVSKLLLHLPVSDRFDAAVTISYEAQARLQDPIYGCVSHIFALQQQVVALQTQLASLKAQASQSFVNLQEHKLFCNKMPSYVIDEQDGSQHGLFPAQEMNEYENSEQKQASFSFDENFSCALEPHDLQDQDMEDLRSIAFAYLHHHA